MQTTPIYGLPYPSPDDSDAPDGPAQIGALAAAVETQLARKDTVADLIVFAASGSLTAAQVTGARALRVRCVGGGGAGGGAVATGVGESSGGGHGQSGHYAESVLDMAALTFPVAVTIAAAATGDPAGGAGNNGGTCSFGTYVSAGGGAGGGSMATGATVGTYAAGGAGGLVATGDITVSGAHGSNAQRLIATIVTVLGVSGSSLLSGARRPGASASSVGGDGFAYGGAGAGSTNGSSQAARAGGTGATGVVLVEPIY